LGTDERKRRKEVNPAAGERMSKQAAKKRARRRSAPSRIAPRLRYRKLVRSWRCVLHCWAKERAEKRGKKARGGSQLVEKRFRLASSFSRYCCLLLGVRRWSTLSSTSHNRRKPSLSLTLLPHLKMSPSRSRRQAAREERRTVGQRQPSRHSPFAARQCRPLPPTPFSSSPSNDASSTHLITARGQRVPCRYSGSAGGTEDAGRRV
jgi:hypothetical protein